MFEKFCQMELQVLKQYKGKTRTEILTSAVSARLDAGLASYMKDLDTSITYLANKNPVKIINKLGKL